MCRKSINKFIRFIFICLFSVWVTQLISQIENHNVYFFGNLIDIDDFDQYYQSLDQKFNEETTSFSLIVNGDLVDHFVDIKKPDDRLDHIYDLIDLIENHALGKLYLITGDRDWNNSQKGGLRSVLGLEKQVKDYVDERGYKNTFWTNTGACPGPEVFELEEHVVLITLNSQWWNHPFDKPIASDAECKYVTDLEISEELDDIIEDNINRNVLIAGHMPIVSVGQAGGRFSVSDHLKPFPIIGSFVKSFRKNIGSSIDLSNKHIKPYIKLLENTLFVHNNLIFISGQDRSHQYFEIEDNFFINSGAPTRGEHVAKDWQTFESSNTPGLVKLQYGSLGDVRTNLLEYKNGRLLEETEQMLFASVCRIDQHGDIIENLAFVPCQTPIQDYIENTDASQQVRVSASSKYKRRGFSEFWMGKHYRDTWSQPIVTSYLDLNNIYGGLSVKKRGGGRQTTSLRFKDINDNEYTFRSIDKDPVRALEYNLRNTIIASVFRDQTSAQYPYGGLVVDRLLDEIDILHASPKVYLLPNVPELGRFREKFANLYGMLEVHPNKPNRDGKYFADADNILKSSKLFKKMYQHQKHQVDIEEYIRARLFDILVGDWSRHEDNWKWAAFEKNNRVIYRPIPRDRDMVFSKWDGVLPWIADRPFGLPNIENFGDKIMGFKSLVFQAKYLDRFLTPRADKKIFIQEAKKIQNEITNKEIEIAIQRIPKEVIALDKNELVRKLINRKDDLQNYAEKYYEWLNKEVSITGSAKKDHYEITINQDESVSVLSWVTNNPEEIYFRRTFYPDETKEIRIYGLNNDDTFNIASKGKSNIKIRLFGGPGDDQFLQDKKSISKEVYVYDRGDKSSHSIGLNKVDHWNRELYEFNRTGLKFNSYFPKFLLTYSRFNGFTISGGANFTRHRWNKRDYASKHSVSGGVSTKGDVSFNYKGRWHHVLIKKWDATFETGIANPNFINSFYGIGNATEIDPLLDANDFYIAEYHNYFIKGGIARRFWKKSDIYFNLGFETNVSSRRENSILEVDPNALGANQSLNLLPVNIGLDLDFRDGGVFPFRGVKASIAYTFSRYLGSNQYGSFGQLASSLEYFATGHGRKPLTLGVKIGGLKGFGDIPFYKQASLGSDFGLRGFDSRRFTGTSSIYLNSELRWHLWQIQSSIPLKIGVMGFYDLGRVFSSFDELGNLENLHAGYGGGVYVSPFSDSFTFTMYLSFSDERSFFPLFSLGTRL